MVYATEILQYPPGGREGGAGEMMARAMGSPSSTLRPALGLDSTPVNFRTAPRLAGDTFRLELPSFS